MSDTDTDDGAEIPFDKARFAENEVIFDEGNEGDGAYMILAGTVEVRKGMRSSNPQVLAVLKKGDMLGEMALADDSPRMASAIATSDVTVIRISRDEFQRRVATLDPTMQTIMRLMIKRVRDMTDEFMRRKGA